MTGFIASERRRTWSHVDRLKQWLSPTLVVALFLAAYLAVILSGAGGDPLVFVRLGDGFQAGRPVGEPGYDGQFAYLIALDPRPAALAGRLDVPAYRYQRILYPMLARLVALGQPALIPWALVSVNLAAQLVGTALVERCLTALGASRWYALTYGLWAGLVLAVRLDLNEPLCYALVAGAALAHIRGRAWLSAVAIGLAVFAKETALVFWFAQMLWAVLNRKWAWLALDAAVLAPFALFQLLLAAWFGSPGLTSGGYLGTSFEWLPYMGLWRIGLVSLPALALLGSILVPLVVLPSLWGLAAAARRLWARDTSAAVLALAANAALIPVTPFSTFREPLGMIRLASGLVLSTLWFAAHARSKRALNYSLLWLAALALIVRDA